MANKFWISVGEDLALFLRRSATKFRNSKTLVPAILLLYAFCFGGCMLLLLLSDLFAGNRFVNGIVHANHLLPSLQFTNGGLGLLIGFSVLKDGDFGRVGEEYLRRWKIWRLAKVNYGSLVDEEKRENCCICLEEIGSEEIVRILSKCCHKMHGDCIDEWLLSQTTCPVCRAPVCP